MRMPACALLSSLALIAAGLAPVAKADGFAPAAALSDEQLDSLRGGFVLPNGVSVSIGLEIATQVNGDLVLETQRSTDDATAVAPAKVTFAADGLRVEHVIGPSVSTLISNTANDRSIDTIYTLNVQVKADWPLRNALTSVDRIALDALDRR